LIKHSVLSQEVTRINYIEPLCVENWIKPRNKPTTNASIIWKPLGFSFPLIGNSLAWKVGNGLSVRVGIYP
jgi:hypothetical protein